jgi:hypothetical protein
MCRIVSLLFWGNDSLFCGAAIVEAARGRLLWVKRKSYSRRKWATMVASFCVHLLPKIVGGNGFSKSSLLNNHPMA